MRWKTQIFGVLTITAFWGCATGSRSQVQFTQDVMVTIGNGEPVLQKKGAALALDEEKSVLVESPGRVGVLVVPSKREPTVTEITLRPADQWAGPNIQPQIDHTLNEVVGHINDIQMLLAGGRMSEAKLAIEVLRQRYPRISQLRMLEASYHVAQGEKTRAALVLNEIIRENPNHLSAKQFLKSLNRSRMPASEMPSSEEDK